MEAAGASAKVILEMVAPHLEVLEARNAKRRKKDKERKRLVRADSKRTVKDTTRTGTESQRQEATVADSPRARLFREGKGALLTLNITQSRAGALITEWLKLTHDDDQLVMATIMKAQELAVNDAPGWILATLRSKVKPNGKAPNPVTEAANRAVERFSGGGSEMREAPVGLLRES